MVDAQGNTIINSPTWLNAPSVLYTSSQCVPDVKVGIGKSSPNAKLHIKVSNSATKAIIVEGVNNEKILQLNPDGKLFTRDVRVDLESWPDYVFDSTYNLIPLSDLKSYIVANKHLPAVPSACEMEESGISVSQSSVVMMEKIEELTLYLIQLQEQLQAQQKEIQELKMSLLNKN